MSNFFYWYLWIFEYLIPTLCLDWLTHSITKSISTHIVAGAHKGHNPWMHLLCNSNTCQWSGWGTFPVNKRTLNIHKQINLNLVLYTNTDQTLVISLHGQLNREIGGLDCHVITTEYRTRVHCIHL